MGARYLKAEEAVIRAHYPTATRAEMGELIPNRTWAQVGVYARKKGLHRTSEAKGNSVREGRKNLRTSWTDSENKLFDELYPTATYVQLIDAFRNRTLNGIQVHAHRRHLHRTKEARNKQMKIGKREKKGLTRE